MAAKKTGTKPAPTKTTARAAQPIPVLIQAPEVPTNDVRTNATVNIQLDANSGTKKAFVQAKINARHKLEDVLATIQATESANGKLYAEFGKIADATDDAELAASLAPYKASFDSAVAATGKVFGDGVKPETKLTIENCDRAKRIRRAKLACSFDAKFEDYDAAARLEAAPFAGRSNLVLYVKVPLSAEQTRILDEIVAGEQKVGALKEEATRIRRYIDVTLPEIKELVDAEVTERWLSRAEGVEEVYTAELQETVAKLFSDGAKRAGIAGPSATKAGKGA